MKSILVSGLVIGGIAAMSSAVTLICTQPQIYNRVEQKLSAVVERAVNFGRWCVTSAKPLRSIKDGYITYLKLSCGLMVIYVSIYHATYIIKGVNGGLRHKSAHVFRGGDILRVWLSDISDGILIAATFPIVEIIKCFD